MFENDKLHALGSEARALAHGMTAKLRCESGV